MRNILQIIKAKKKSRSLNNKLLDSQIYNYWFNERGKKNSDNYSACYINDNAQTIVPAVNLAKVVSDYTGGKGGGSAKIAQIGGQIDSDKVKIIGGNLTDIIDKSIAS